jgi:5-methylcytosine-specific restriction endonuclease McrA
MVSHLSAQLMDDMQSVVDGYVETGDVDGDQRDTHIEFAATEVRAALTLTRRAADMRVHAAVRLNQDLPAVVDALRRGDIDKPRVLAIAQSTEHLEPHIARQVVDELLPHAPGLTTGQIRARLRKLAFEVEPEEAKERFELASDRRRVVFWSTSDGTASLEATDLPPARVAEIRRRIDTHAKSLAADGETRSMDQLRADVLLDLLTGTDEAKVGRGVVDIRVDLEALAGLADSSGDLNGFGPVIADIARQTAEQQREAEWRWLVTEPGTSRPLASGITRRRPMATQKRLVEQIHSTCAFPGCRMPARDSDIDHTVPYSEGGSATASNLVPLCRHDHRIRHEAGWTYRTTPTGYRWTSPVGLEYDVDRATGVTALANGPSP